MNTYYMDVRKRAPHKQWNLPFARKGRNHPTLDVTNHNRVKTQLARYHADFQQHR